MLGLDHHLQTQSVRCGDVPLLVTCRCDCLQWRSSLDQRHNSAGKRSRYWTSRGLPCRHRKHHHASAAICCACTCHAWYCLGPMHDCWLLHHASICNSILFVFQLCQCWKYTSMQQSGKIVKGLLVDCRSARHCMTTGPHLTSMAFLLARLLTPSLQPGAC